MTSPYDNYDYPSYWEGREYEHLSESLAIKQLLQRIPHLKTILEVGTGYGRLIDLYEDKGDKVILSDPSSKLLKLAKKNKNSKKFIVKQSNLENLKNQIKPNSIDLIVMVRVMHHIKNCDDALKNINHLIKDGGYLLIEFPNKRHIKNTLKNFIRGNFKYYFNQLPVDIGKKDGVKILPFKNFHPQMILNLLIKNDYTIVKKLSVSNMRHKIFKKVLRPNQLLLIEKILQRPFSYLSFGPSIFILAKKQ